MLRATSAAELVQRMHTCGAVAMSKALPTELIRSLSVGVGDVMRPILESRKRVCRLLASAAVERANATDGDLWELHADTLASEPIVTAYSDYQERSSGRIDFGLPWQPPFNDSELVADPHVLPLLYGMMGEDVELKAVRVVYALSGAPVQQFHRDGNDLFPEVEVEVRHQPGRHQPAYAANVFVPLIDMDNAGAGPTEFIFGSHGHRRPINATINAAHATLVGTFRTAAGVSDCRVVHRGLEHTLDTPRPMLMLIYGRRWWEDNHNYEKLDYMAGRESPAFARAIREKQCYSGDESKTLLLRRHRAADADPSERRRASFRRFVHSTFQWGGCALD